MITQEILNQLKEASEKATKYRPTRLLEKYHGYACAVDGSIWSMKSNWRGYGARPLIPIDNGHGYLKIRFSIDGKRINRTVHTLICEAFNGPKPTELHEVRHLDGNRHNNNINNLILGTCKENANDRTKHGNCKAAENGRKSAHKLRKRKP